MLQLKQVKHLPARHVISSCAREEGAARYQRASLHRRHPKDLLRVTAINPIRPREIHGRKTMSHICVNSKIEVFFFTSSSFWQCVNNRRTRHLEAEQSYCTMFTSSAVWSDHSRNAHARAHDPFSPLCVAAKPPFSFLPVPRPIACPLCRPFLVSSLSLLPNDGGDLQFRGGQVPFAARGGCRRGFRPVNLSRVQFLTVRKERGNGASGRCRKCRNVNALDFRA